MPLEEGKPGKQPSLFGIIAGHFLLGQEIAAVFVTIGSCEARSVPMAVALQGRSGHHALMGDFDWELREAGPLDAEHTVLLLPGGACSAGSYAEVMAEPALAGMRLVAATLPGHAGAPPPDDYTMENNALLAAALAKQVGACVVVGCGAST